jgi:putative pyruvate formate lyase activating enzyme
MPQILEALVEAAARGFRLPLVWNCGGWESPEALALLDGVVDIYMPDAKYQDDAVAERLSYAPGYRDACRGALREMYRQVGDLRVDERGIARSGLLVRHLVLPGALAGTEALAEFLATEVSPDTYVNVMSQYRPAYRAREFAEIARATSRAEWAEAVESCVAAGLRRLDPRA